MKRILLFIFILLHSKGIWAGCSPYMGLASINEIHKRFLFLDNSDDFVEVKKLDKNLSNSVMATWHLEICETIFSIFYSCSGPLSLADATQTGKYWVYQGSPEPSSYIDWIGGFDIVLSDENGDVVDYVSADGVDPQFEACTYPFPYTVNSTTATRRTYRTPDGVGEWGVPPGNSFPESAGDINDDDPPPVDAPSLGFVSDVVIPQGGTAQLTMALDAPYTSDVVINYASVNGEAVAGVDYVSSAGSVTIPAGEVSVDITVDSIVTGNTVDSYFFMTIESAPNADVTVQVAKITIIQGAMADHFSISHSGQGANCEPSTIVIQAKDEDGDVITNYQGTIELNTTTGNGDWSQIVPLVGLTPGPSDSGYAEYEFTTDDEGEVILGLSNTHEETLSINVLDGFNVSELTGSAQSSDDPPLTFTNAIFKFLYNTGALESETFETMTAHKTVTNGNGDDPILLRAITTDINTGQCTSLFSGVQSIELALQCMDANNCDASGQSPFNIGVEPIAENTLSVNGYSAINLTFTANGTATLSDVRYLDVGEVQLHARKTFSDGTVLGASNSLVFLPAGFCLQVNDVGDECTGTNDAEYAQCGVFKKAGELFSVTVTSQGWQSDGDTNLCDNNAITRSFNHAVDIGVELIAPSAGNSGYLTTSSTVLSSGENTLDLSWSEVGVLAISMGGNTYLSRTLPATTSAEIGRFIPAQFKLIKQQDGGFDAANLSFTYAGQLDGLSNGAMGYDLVPKYSLQAENDFSTPDIIENYVGDFFKNPEPNLNVLVNTLGKDGLTPLTLTADFSDHQFTYNTSTDTYEIDFSVQDHFVVDRDSQAEIAPFILDADIILSSMLDEDSVTSNGITFNLAGSEIRYGRIYIEPAYGSQYQNVAHRLYAQYFDGQQYQLNGLDNVFSVDTANFYDFAITDTGDPLDPLQLTDTSLSGTLFNIGQLSSGEWALQWSPTTAGRYGDIGFRYQVPQWLRYNWDDSVDNSQEDPSGSISFGQYRGHDKVIYWQEIY